MEYTKSSELKKQETKPCLNINDTIVFNINNNIYTGIVKSVVSKYYVAILPLYINNIVFENLGIEDSFKFVHDIQGYTIFSNYNADYIWPFSSTLEDLTKVVKKLLKLCEKTTKEVFPQGDLKNPIPISSGIQFKIGHYYSVGDAVLYCYKNGKE